MRDKNIRPYSWQTDEVEADLPTSLDTFTGDLPSKDNQSVRSIAAAGAAGINIRNYRDAWAGQINDHPTLYKLLILDFFSWSFYLILYFELYRAPGPLANYHNCLVAFVLIYLGKDVYQRARTEPQPETSQKRSDRKTIKPGRK